LEKIALLEKKVSLGHCIIGKNCTVQSGSTIGEDGFAFERPDWGKLIHFPHLGKVMIGKGADIGANCFIARGSMSNTIIGSGPKLGA
jgi:UDP-3-O-[3-hydroxymyristoyl] glucosamine N-acyltransferase